MHDLIKDGVVIDRWDFQGETPPVLAAHKGKWLPKIRIDATWDENTQDMNVVHTLTATESIYEQVITPKPQAQLDAYTAKLADEDDAVEVKGDTQVKALILATPLQIENYINNNVTDLSSANAVIAILAKAISALGKTEFR
jgi:hypothetical protein